MTGPKPSPTGTFPEGKLGPNDEGGLNIRIAANAKDGQVHVHFACSIEELAMPPHVAIQIAVELISAATRLMGASAMGAHKGEA